MARVHRSFAARALLTIVFTLAVVGVSAASQHAGKYLAKTSQKQTIKFSVSRGYVRGLEFRILEKCSGGRTLVTFEVGFPPLAINRLTGAFGFPSKRANVVRGKIVGKKATGTLKDAFQDPPRWRNCHGVATFTASTP